MPNHVTNVLILDSAIVPEIVVPPTKEELAEWRAEVEETQARRWARGITGPYDPDPPAPRFDFRVLIPQPAGIERGDCSGRHAEGVVCWLTWNTENWGTKWNAYGTTVEPEGYLSRVKFETAWSHPFPVIVALSKRFPDMPIRAMYADEELGYNLGTYMIQAGVKIEQYDFVEGTEKAREFAAQLTGYDLDGEGDE